MQPTLIRRALLADAILSGAAGIVMIVGGAALAPLLNLPAELLVGAGVFFIPWTLALLWIARATQLPRTGAQAVIALNVAWVLASIGVLFVLTPSPFGAAFVIAQAIAVGVLAELQYIGLKRAPAAA
ncbi:hypothetical protein [Vitreimonas flagellata]|uniref:hypothetical protein n=1 Tax=Vitreimonas flagellata TaxID=2560861 RepID=UPI00107515BE|nr:hypothetical protein [Vitreimonas flagellata]